MENTQPIVKKVITTVGVKPATSALHNKLRVFALIIVLVAVVWAIYNDGSEEVDIVEIEDHIKPGTMIHQSIGELDDTTKQCYIKSIKDMIRANETTRVSTYLRGIQVSLLAGFISEYIVNGNFSKPFGIISKTVLYSALYTTATQ